MQTPIVREFREDLLNKNPENRIRQEPFLIEEEGEWSRIIVPQHSPFFIKSLKLYFKNGQPMTAEHFEIFKIMPGLTGLAAQGVACMIRLKDPTIVEGFLDYDVVGEFSLFDSSMMSLVMGAVNDDRMIDWKNLKNKPLVFPPKLHSHSLLYDIVAFQDTIDLLDSIVKMTSALGRPLIQVKINSYFSNFNRYLGLYKKMLMQFLNDHVNSDNSHGIKADQVNLGNVDNFATAVSTAEIMSGRDDLHMTVDGLRTIVQQTGFESSEFLGKGTLPISQFGNSHFIPPSIDGSFEGLGGISETAGITMESDGTVVFLANRMDGRVTGLYYSTLDDLYGPSGTTMKYTSYKYIHQKFQQDGSSVDRIVQGSGSEVILVGNNRTNFYYVGLTNGTLDPTKHVYSRLNMSPIFELIAPGDPVRARSLLEAKYFGQLSVVLLGDWIYILLAHSFKTPGVLEDVETADARYRRIYRVRVADVAAQIDVTLVQQNVTFQDIRGIQYNNAPDWRWCTPVGNGDDGYTSYIYNFSAPPTSLIGCYRSQQTVVCKHRDKPGIYLVRFTSYFWCRYTPPVGESVRLELTLEILYEFNPVTGVFTKLKNTPTPNINWDLPLPVIVSNLAELTSVTAEQGLTVLEDGSIVVSQGIYPAFPRRIYALKPGNSSNRFETMMLLWYNEIQNKKAVLWWETVISPLESSINPRNMLFTVGGNFYTAALKANSAVPGLFYKKVAGRLVSRADVTNLLINNIVSQPLTNDIKAVNADFRMGGANVTVPSSQLATYGMDVGDSAFCMGVQGKYLNIHTIGKYWGNVADPDAIRIFGAHNIINETNGTVSIQPTAEIIYPANIVQLFKNQAEFPAFANATSNVAITVTDPTGRLTDKFGWLPVIVTVMYCPPGAIDFYGTVLTIVPTYSISGNVKTVTGFTVLDKQHRFVKNYAPQGWQWGISGSMGMHGVPRTGYYLNGNVLDIVVDTGVVFSGPGDSVRMNAYLKYPNRTTRRWSPSESDSYTIMHGNGGFTHYTVVPDSGVVAAYPYAQSTGGAATIYRGIANNPLLGSVYPETGWVVYFQTAIDLAFNGKAYTLPAGSLDLRDFDSSPQNKTFYLYAKLENGEVGYDVSQEKRFETPFQVWAAKIVTNDRQILTIERFNVFAINGSRVSEIKRGNSIPASSGLVNTEGQIPWLRSSEMLP